MKDCTSWGYTITTTTTTIIIIIILLLLLLCPTRNYVKRAIKQTPNCKTRNEMR
jgi:hypothetical protein